MREFIIREEGFSLKFTEKVPEPNEGECFLLYQEGTGLKKSMVVSRGVKYSSSAVRREHYNRKVTFSLRKQGFTQKFHVVTANTDFSFQVDVSLSCEIQDVQEYYFGEWMEEDTLCQIVKKCMVKQHKRWQIKQGWELQRELDEDIGRALKQFAGLRFRVVVEVRLDEAAEKILKSDRDSAVDIHLSDNRKNVQIAGNEHRAAIAESESALKMQQIGQIRMLLQNFGTLGPVANEYLEGKIDGKEFYSYIMKARAEEMDMLKVAMEGDLIPTDDIMVKINDILSNRQFGEIEQKQPAGSGGALEMRSSGQTDMAYAAREEEEAETPADGDFL